jgi:chorismate synthase
MLRLLTAGESHGPALTAILDGVPAGLRLPRDAIDRELARRQQGHGSGARMKIEHDRVQILGGLLEGTTTGGPIALLIRNADHERWRGAVVEPMTKPRPGHADLTGAVKYGYRDLRPASERASARETTARVAAGAVCKHFLAQFDIRVGGYVVAIGDVAADLGNMSHEDRLAHAEDSPVRCPLDTAATAMEAAIEHATRAKDTLGGEIEVVAMGVPIGLGSFTQWDARLDARLARAVMSVQAIKGVAIGDAFANARRSGSEAHDAIEVEPSQGILRRPTNRAGGIEAGVSNGNPIVVRAAMKPIATTLAPQSTVDLVTGKDAETAYERSDFCPVPRAVPILEGMVALVLADALIAKLGGDSVQEMLPRFASLRTATLDDLPMDGTTHVLWEDE